MENFSGAFLERYPYFDKGTSYILVNLYNNQCDPWEPKKTASAVQTFEKHKKTTILASVKSITLKDNDITYIIRGAIFKVYNELGPGLLESTYEAALKYELTFAELSVRSQVAMPVKYADTILTEIGYRIDLLVEERIIIEIKSVEAITSVHHKQLLTYLKLSGLPIGILVNFNTMDISKSIIRKVNGDQAG